MINIEEMIKNEKSSDVVLYFSRNENGIGISELDFLLSKYKPDAHNADTLIKTLDGLLRKKCILIDSKMAVMKGKKWEEPKFMKLNKYKINMNLNDE